MLEYERNSPQERLRLARTAPEVVHLMNEGGWCIDRGTAHRGVLTADEWRFLDHEAVIAEVEELLGFTIEELRSVFRQGRKTAAQRALRARVEARFLAIHRAGGNLAALGRIAGIAECTFTRALVRARRDAA
jgi:hypothetical protein